jgi:hypothetical protein
VTRRFPPPWSVEELDACFVVIDSAGQKFTLRLFRERAGPSSGSASRANETRRIAANTAKLPELVRKQAAGASSAQSLTGRSHDVRHSNHRSDGGDNDNKGSK